MKKTLFCLFLLLLCTFSSVLSGERAFSWTQAPAKGDYIGVKLNPYNLGKYLTSCEINRPEILTEVNTAIRDGDYYRKSTKDQKGKPVKITINVNPDYMLRIVTWRNEQCETCNGNGRKDLPFDKFTKGVKTAIRCPDCKGKGYLENHTTEKYFILSPEDFESPEEGRKIMAGRAYADAPKGASTWVERLVSKDPLERLQACEWLDENYVSIGSDFQSIMPMLKKARYQEANEKKKIIVWQFWAGKDHPDERNRAYYRIYVNSKTGKVTQKGFYAAK